MSLADIVPLIPRTRMERRKKTRAEIMRDWQVRNREHLRNYKRQWDQKRKEAA